MPEEVTYEDVLGRFFCALSELSDAEGSMSTGRGTGLTGLEALKLAGASTLSGGKRPVSPRTQAASSSRNAQFATMRPSKMSAGLFLSFCLPAPLTSGLLCSQGRRVQAPAPTEWKWDAASDSGGGRQDGGRC